MMLVNMVIYLPLKACQEWGVIIAIQHYGMSPTVGSSLVTWHELGGVLSGFVAPLLSDLCGGRRTLVFTPLNKALYRVAHRTVIR
jgi:sugar phosphate permease|eukprot:COSAG03_NODE_700_length_6205_cov_3.689977_7_plen_85_part_00